MFDGQIEKTSSESKKFNYKQFITWYLYPIFPFIYFIPGARPKFTDKDGTITEFGVSKDSPPKGRDKFTGEVYVLIDEGTFSTANAFASVMQCNGLGKVVGRNTGEPVLGDGNPTPVKLPHTGLLVRIGTSIFKNACARKADENNLLGPDLVSPKRGEGDELQFLLDRMK